MSWEHRRGLCSICITWVYMTRAGLARPHPAPVRIGGGCWGSWLPVVNRWAAKSA